MLWAEIGWVVLLNEIFGTDTNTPVSSIHRRLTSRRRRLREVYASCIFGFHYT